MDRRMVPTTVVGEERLITDGRIAQIRRHTKKNRVRFLNDKYEKRRLKWNLNDWIRELRNGVWGEWGAMSEDGVPPTAMSSSTHILGL